MRERGKTGCVPHDTIAAKDETYSEPNSPSHERAHSSQEKVLNGLVSDCKIGHTSLSVGEQRDMSSSDTKLAWKSGQTHLLFCQIDGSPPCLTGGGIMFCSISAGD